MRQAAVAVVAVAVLLSGCGDDRPVEGVEGADDVRTAPSSSAVGDGTPPASARPPSPSDPTQDGAQPVGQPSPTVVPPTADGPDLDGDGQGDRVALVEVPDMGWSFDVVLADGRESSAPLPADLAVGEDVEVLGGVDLDADGSDEVLVRTLRAVGGQNAVVFRLDGDGVWLVRTPEGTAWELSTAGGTSGPRSWDCDDVAQAPRREVRTREAERETGADGASTYAVRTVTWQLDGHGVTAVAKEAATGVLPEQVQLDPSTCTR